MKKRFLFLLLPFTLLVVSLCINVVYFFNRHKTEKALSNLEKKLPAFDSAKGPNGPAGPLRSDTTDVLYYTIDGKDYTPQQIIDSAFVWKANMDYFKQVFEKASINTDRAIDIATKNASIAQSALDKFSGASDTVRAFNLLMEYLKKHDLQPTVKIEWEGNTRTVVVYPGNGLHTARILKQYYDKGKLNIKIQDSLVTVTEFKAGTQ